MVFVAVTQPMYNLTVDEAHTFFIGDGQWLVHNSCWVDELIEKRSVAIPEGRTLDDSVVNDVVDALSSKGNVAKGNIAILEADGRWFAGMSRNLDAEVSGMLTKDRLTINPPSNNLHAEGNALAEFYSFNGGNPAEGINGTMYGTNPPCSSCVRQPGGQPAPGYPGVIQDVIHEVGIQQLNVFFQNSGGFALPWSITR